MVFFSLIDWNFHNSESKPVVAYFLKLRPKLFWYLFLYFQMMKPYVWLQTSDDSIQQVEQEIAMFCPLICQEIIQKGMGSSKNCAICLPQQVSPAMLSLILDYCRFHQVPGRSNKVWLLFFKALSYCLYTWQDNSQSEL